ncbi:protein LSM14 homolog B-like [Betta splendens]|uniref:Protein LSM14 homolog B-like n=1 Tax=Betta splendens TaxID=158456 RepID=A0A6P7MZU3_BETSP|nr:protein LSM14 homolog B-like [Betta splendens]XP_055366525.1 protein LSM14 homolog B-like [Betta splendens]
MSSARPYIGCKIGLISKAHNRYEGILYTVDKANSTVVLAKVKCFGTEGRPTDRPTPPKDDIYEYITFRGSDIKDITLCEATRAHHGLPPDPAIIQVQESPSGGASSISGLGPFSPLSMPSYNQLAASSLLNQQYAAALGLGLHVRRGPMVEKSVQTLQVERSRQRRGFSASQPHQYHQYQQEQHRQQQQQQQRQQQQQQQQRERRAQRPRGEGSQTRKGPVTNMKLGQGAPTARQETLQHNEENRPPQFRSRQGPRRRRNRNRGQLMVANVPAATLKFDTDFDFDSSNAQFIKEGKELEKQDKIAVKDGNRDDKGKELHSDGDNDQFGPKCYYDKAKSFFDNISSDNKLRLTWADERKRNLETFGVPGRFLRGRGLGGGYAGRRGRGAAQIQPSYRSRREQL